MAEQRKPRNHIYNIIVVAVLLAVIAVSLIFLPVGDIITSVTHGEAKTEMVTLPTILTYIPSKEENGDKHQLTVTMALELGSGTSAKINTTDISNSLKGVLENVDYDALVKMGDTSYVTDAVEATIKNMLPDDSFRGVYVTKLVTDFNMPGYDPSQSISGETDSNPTQDFLDSLKN